MKSDNLLQKVYKTKYNKECSTASQTSCSKTNKNKKTWIPVGSGCWRHREWRIVRLVGSDLSSSDVTVCRRLKKFVHILYQIYWVWFTLALKRLTCGKFSVLLCINVTASLLVPKFMLYMYSQLSRNDRARASCTVIFYDRGTWNPNLFIILFILS